MTIKVEIFDDLSLRCNFFDAAISNISLSIINLLHKDITDDRDSQEQVDQHQAVEDCQ